MRGSTKTIDADIADFIFQQIRSIEAVNRNFIPFHRKRKQFPHSTAHNFQIHFRTLRPLQTAHDIFRAHLHTGNNRIIHHYNAVTGQNANLLRRTSRYRLYNEKSIFRHIKLNTDSFKIALQRLIHFFYLFRIRINRMRVKLFQHLYNGFFHHLAFIHLVDIQIGNGKLRQLQFTGRGIH